MSQNIHADEGFFFGLGAFETIAVEDGHPAFLDRHLHRLAKALNFLEIDYAQGEVLDAIAKALAKKQLPHERLSLKVVVSEKNMLTRLDGIRYCTQDYERGFVTSISSVRRNETSPLTFHKTLNYGDCIREKRHAQRLGIHEPLFLNTAGQLTEGATSNLFFVRDGKLVTPPTTAGLLAGIMRDFVCENFRVTERTVLPEEIHEFDEMFLTNSLMIAMPVVRLGHTTFRPGNMAKQVRAAYRRYLTTRSSCYRSHRQTQSD